MLLRILGPVGANGKHGAVPLGGPRHRVLLAALQTCPGRVVGADRLLEGAVGKGAPAAGGPGAARADQRAAQAAAGRHRRAPGSETASATPRSCSRTSRPL